MKKLTTSIMSPLLVGGKGSFNLECSSEDLTRGAAASDVCIFAPLSFGPLLPSLGLTLPSPEINKKQKLMQIFIIIKIYRKQILELKDIFIIRF